MGTKIASIGYQFPRVRVSNEEWSGKFAPKTPLLGNDFTRFIAEGVEQRFYMEPGALVDEIAAEAATDCLRRVNFPVGEVEHIIHLSNVSDVFVNGDGPKLQDRIGARGASTVDLAGGSCAGFLIGLNMATALIEAGRYRNVLLSCVSNAGTRAADHRDVSGSTVGDLATSILLVRSDDDAGLLGFCHETRGEYYHLHTHKEVLDGKRTWEADAGRHWGKHFFYIDHRDGILAAQQGAGVHAPNAARRALERANKTVGDMQWFVTHQPGSAPMKLWDKVLGFDAARHPNSLAEVGNVSICSIPFTLRRMLDKAAIESGQLMLFLTPASGQHVISMVWRW